MHFKYKIYFVILLGFIVLLSSCSSESVYKNYFETTSLHHPKFKTQSFNVFFKQFEILYNHLSTAVVAHNKNVLPKLNVNYSEWMMKINLHKEVLSEEEQMTLNNYLENINLMWIEQKNKLQ